MNSVLVDLQKKEQKTVVFLFLISALCLRWYNDGCIQIENSKASAITKYLDYIGLVFFGLSGGSLRQTHIISS